MFKCDFLPFLISNSSGYNIGGGPSSGHCSDFVSGHGSVPESNPADVNVRID